MDKTVYITAWTLWAPGVESEDEQEEWAQGKREILLTDEAPALPFVPPLLKRRMSQLSRMTIQVMHDILPYAPEGNVVFVSQNGESTRQMQINKMIVQEKMVTPAAFSLSVFNAPPALASIALGHKAGYTAVYPAGNILQQGFICATAPIIAEQSISSILIFADELLIPEYRDLIPKEENTFPFAAAFAISAESNDKNFNFAINNDDSLPASDVLEFLRFLYAKRGHNGK